MIIPKNFSLSNVLFMDIETHLELPEELSHLKSDPFHPSAKPHHKVIAFAAQRASEREATAVLLRESAVETLKSGWSVTGAGEAALLGKYSKILTSGGGRDPAITVGWNVKDFDLTILGHRSKDLSKTVAGSGKALEVLHAGAGSPHIDFKEAFREAVESLFGKEAGARPWSLEAVAKDFRIPGKVGNLSVGKDELVSLIAEGKGGELLGYVKQDVEIMPRLEQKTGLLSFLSSKGAGKEAWASEEGQKLKTRLLPLVEDPSGNLLYPRSKAAYTTFKGVIEERGAFVGVTGTSGTGKSSLSRWVRSGEGGFKTGDVNWILLPEGDRSWRSRATEEGKGVLAVAFEHKGRSYSYNLESGPERISYTRVIDQIAKEMGDEEHFLNKRRATEAARAARLRKAAMDTVETAQVPMTGAGSQSTAFEATAEGLLKKVKRALEIGDQRRSAKDVALGALGAVEAGGPPGVHEQVSGTVARLLGASKTPLIKVAPYAAGVVAGLDLLASRDKAPSVYGAIAGGGTYLLAAGLSPLPRVAAAAGVYAGTKMIMGALRRVHAPPIPAFEEQGEGSINRKALTPFGSGYDAMIAIARRKGVSLGRLLKMKEVRAALHQAAEFGEMIASGGEGSIHLHQATIFGEEVSFVTKRYRVPAGPPAVSGLEKTLLVAPPPGAERAARERGALKVLGESAPTVYGWGVGRTRKGGEYSYNILEYLDPEKFQTLESHLHNKGGISSEAISAFEAGIERLHNRKMYHGDLHAGNILVGPKGDFITLDPFSDKLKPLQHWMDSFSISTLQKRTDVHAISAMRTYEKRYKLGGIDRGPELVEELLTISQSMALSALNPGDYTKAIGVLGISDPEGPVRWANRLFKDIGVITQSGTMDFISHPPLDRITPRVEMIQREMFDGRIPVREGQRLMREAGAIGEVSQLSEPGAALTRAPKGEIEGLRVHEGLPKVPAGGTRWNPVRAFKDLVRVTTKNAKTFEELLEVATESRYLGAGGMGTVTLMEAECSGQKFKFVKKVFDQGHSKETAKRYMEREVSFLKAFESSIAPTVYKSGKKGKESYILMEYIEGAKTVGEIIESGGTISKRTWRSFEEAMREAHRKGMYLGDINKNNLLVDSKGRGVIIDMMPRRFEPHIDLFHPNIDKNVRESIEMSFGMAVDRLALEAMQAGKNPGKLLNMSPEFLNVAARGKRSFSPEMKDPAVLFFSVFKKASEEHGVSLGQTLKGLTSAEKFQGGTGRLTKSVYSLWKGNKRRSSMSLLPDFESRPPIQAAQEKSALSKTANEVGGKRASGNTVRLQDLHRESIQGATQGMRGNQARGHLNSARDIHNERTFIFGNRR